MAELPPLPPGFKLDQPQAEIPPLPPGFTLDSEPSAAKESQGLLDRAGEELSQGAGMAARTITEGATDLIMLPGNALVSLANKAFGTSFQTPSESRSYVLDQLGLPKPDTDSERMIDAASKGAIAALTSVGLAGAVGKAATGATKNVLGVIADAPGAAAGAGASGAASSELVRQQGGGPVAQTVAGVVGSVVPGATRALVGEAGKRLVRGGETGRMRTEQNIQEFESSGASPSMGQAAQTRRMQAAESLLSKTPGGAGVMTRRAGQQADDIGSSVERSAAKLAPKSSSEQAGRAIQRGISDSGGFLDQFKSKSAQLYDEIDNFIKPNSPVAVTSTQRTLADLTRVTPGAAATTSRLINRRIAEIADDVKVDAQSGAIPYEALKAIRTRVGEELADAPLKGDVPQAQWKKLYGALSNDLEAAAKTAGPDASRAYTRANNYYRAGSRRMDVLQSVMDRNGGPEAVFRAATSGTKEGATTLRAVMQSVPKDQQKVVTATVLRRLGRAKPGQQDDLGETFSTETFLTNWNSMAPEAKGVLFNRFGPTFRQDMDTLAKVASNLREGSQVFKNPSGTGQAVTQATTAATFIMSIVTGNVGTAGAIAGGVTGANLAARLFTNPRAVRWLATKTKAPISAIPALAAQLSKSDDADLRSLSAALQQAQNEEKDK